LGPTCGLLPDLRRCSSPAAEGATEGEEEGAEDSGGPYGDDVAPGRCDGAALRHQRVRVRCGLERRRSGYRRPGLPSASCTAGPGWAGCCWSLLGWLQWTRWPASARGPEAIYHLSVLFPNL